MSALSPTSGSPPVDLDRLRSSQSATLDTEKARLRKATKEFESFFLYYMLKTMRETLTNESASAEAPLSGGMGKETYQQMFDMEISRHVVRGDNRSLSAMLYKSMEKLVEARFKADQGKTEASAPKVSGTIHQPAPPLPLKTAEPAIVLPKQSPFRPVERTTQSNFAPIAAIRTIQTKTDPIQAQFGDIIAEAARENQLDSALIHSVIKAESNGDPNAISRAGAKGLMQLADSTSTDLGVANPFDPRANVFGGAKYLRTLINRFKGDLRLALAAYNSGPAMVDKHGGVPPFRETRDYIDRVTTYLRETSFGESSPLK
jgi:soluble lytic murein transglycosylase-like protein